MRARWQVGEADQADFVTLSGDSNPLHVDPLIARRTTFGRVAVHGVHLALDAVERIAAFSGLAPTAVGCTLRRSVGIGDTLVTTFDVAGAMGRAEVAMDVWTAAEVTVALGPPPPQCGDRSARLARSRGAPVIAADAPLPVGYGLDHHDLALVTELVALQQAINEAFDEALGATPAEAPVERLRLAALQHTSGTLASFDRRNWVMYRQPFSDEFAARVGSSVAELMAARRGVPPKVLVLDCDNTLWAGVLADDGLGALQCGDAFPGFAYHCFQLAVQRLRHRGVLLALSSKNDPERVVEAFATVDGMVLGDADIAAKKISWAPKPEGITALAGELNLGLEAMVFVDDSDFELGEVATRLPQVRTLRVPDDIEELPDLLAESG